ncbi:MAG: GNAT family N-acetyltransferase [Nakamurella sp.]
MRAVQPVGADLASTFFDAQQAGGVVYLIAWEGPEPLGDGVLVTGAGDVVPELKNLNVRATHRSRGVGSALIRAAEEVSRAQGADRMEVGVSLDNSRARALYERLGYVGTGRQSTVTYEYLDDDGNRHTATETSEQLARTL